MVRYLRLGRALQNVWESVKYVYTVVRRRNRSITLITSSNAILHNLSTNYAGLYSI